MYSHQLKIQTSSSFPSLREPVWSEPAHSSPHSSGLFIRGFYLAHCSFHCVPRQHTVNCGCRAHKTHAQASCFGDTFPSPQLNPNSSIVSVWLASPFWVFPDFSPPVILMGGTMQAQHKLRKKSTSALLSAGRNLHVPAANGLLVLS